jgi:2-oxoglutarate ferredoxin oxidoreductase subunit delta
MNGITLLRESCKGTEDCGICIFVCPKDIFANSEEPNDAGYVPPGIKNEEQCTACRNCMISCPDFAIVVEKAPSNPPDEKVGLDG